MTKEEAELAKQLPDWVVPKLDEILGFTAPELMRLQLLDMMVDLVCAADDTVDVG